MRTVLGAILLAIGILIAGASGLCTAVMIGATVLDSSSSSGGEISSVVAMAAVFGGVPFAIGLALFFAGRHLIRSDREQGDQP